MQRFLKFRFLIPVLLVLLTNCKLGDLYKRRRVDDNNDQKKQDDQVLLGVPLLYEQRKYVAKELGIDPRLIMGNMRDFIFRDRYPNADDIEDPISLLSGQSLKRKKRGIIWNKIQRVKKGIQRVQKKLVSVRNRITQLLKGPETSTERPKYASTAGDGGPKWKGNSGGSTGSSGSGWSGNTGNSGSGGGNSGGGGSAGWGQGQKSESTGNGWGQGQKSESTGNGWGQGQKSESTGGNGWGQGQKSESTGGNGWGQGQKSESTGNGWGQGQKSESTGNGWGQKNEASGGYPGSTNNQNNQGGYGNAGKGNGWSRSATSSSSDQDSDTSVNSIITNNAPGGASSSTVVNTPHVSSNTWSSQPQPFNSNTFASSYKRSTGSGVSAVRSSRELEMISQRFDSKYF